jgi:TonB family protein
VSVQPQDSSDGSTSPIAASPLSIVDGDYPIGSLLANEEGRTSLNLLVDKAGHVVYAQRLATSGFDRLDEAAIKIARTRWTFKPATNKGQPIAGSVKIDVTWKFPLRPADEFKPDIPDLPAGSNPFNFRRPEPLTTHMYTEKDYPAAAVSRGEQGLVGVKYLIAEDGSIADVRVTSSSSFPILDASAVDLIKSHWKFQPATVDGKPVKIWVTASVIFKLRNGNEAASEGRRFCTSSPIIGTSMSMTPAGGTDAIEVGQWVHITRDGRADDVIVNTEKGWMRFNKALVEQLNQTLRNPSVARGRRPESCWYDGGITVPPIPPGR